MVKNANAKGGQAHTRAAERSQDEASVGQTGKHADDAREDPSRQQKNREELGVSEDHRTQDMKKGRRGTFP